MTKTTMVRDMTTGSITKHLVRFALPIVVANMLQLIYNLVDMAILGHFVGIESVSGVSIGGNALQLCTVFCMGFCSGGQVLIAQYVGANDRKQISETIGTMFTFILGMALVFTVFANILTDPILTLLNTPQDSFAQAREYTRVCYSGLFFIFGYNIVSAILRGMGDSKKPMIFIGISVVLHMVLDTVLVGIIGLGCFGAGLSTVISQGVSFGVSVIYLYSKRDVFGFDFSRKSFKMNPKNLRILVKLGVPLALQSSAITFSTTFVNACVNSYGVIISAVSGAGGKVGQIASVITTSMGTAANAVVAQNISAGRTDRVQETVKSASRILIVAGVFFTLVFLFFPETVFRIFTSDPEVLAWAPVYLKTRIIMFVASCCMTPFNAVVHGIGFANLSLVIGLLDGVVARIGLTLLLGQVLGFGVVGYWVGNSLAGFVTAIISAAYYISGRWKTYKLIQTNSKTDKSVG